MGTHTPGPWRTSWSLAGCWLVYCHNDAKRQHDTHFSREREADARLIAAAPDLLEALRQAVEFMGEEVDNPSDAAPPELLATARAAIAKAAP